MISTTTIYSKQCLTPSCAPSHSPQPLHPTVQESILQMNNDGVSQLQAGNNKTAMIRLARCLAIMRTRASEGESEVHYQFASPLRSNSLSEISKESPRYLFAAPLIVTSHNSYSCSNCSSSKETEQMTCKLLSLVLFNLSLAHHLVAQELVETMQYQVQDELQRREEVCDLLEKSLRLYELCHSSLVFTNSGLLCSDLAIAVVVTNNVGEIHKELHQLREINQNDHGYNRTATACSEQLIQIFMFFAANGQSNQLEGFGDILSNAMATLNGPQIFAPAA